MSLRRFEGKTVLVTGAAGGLGSVIARAFASEGARLILADIVAEPVASLAETLGGGAFSVKVDLTQEESIAQLAREVAARTERLDVLINNAGLAHGEITTALFGVTQARWQHFLAVNTLGPLLLSETLRPLLAAARGIVINQSSMASYQPGTAYGITKAALNAVTHALAGQLAGDGIRCVGVAPGMMETDANRETLGEDVIARMSAMQLAPARRGTPQDIAQVCLFLASEEGGFINAETIAVDAGHRLRGFRP